VIFLILLNFSSAHITAALFLMGGAAADSSGYRAILAKWQEMINL
jgi:hypothetical protein